MTTTSARGTTVGLPVTQPLIEKLPALYQEGGFLEQFTSGLDVVLAPVFATLDCLDAYIDPEVSPEDFLGWLGDWVGLRLDEDWTVERRRRLVAAAATLFAARGTAHGLSDEIELYTGGAAEINDPGRVWTSTLPTGEDERRSRRTADRTVRVTVDVTNATEVNWPALQVLVRDAVPAHLPVEIELRETSTPTRRKKRKDVTPAAESEGGDLPPPPVLAEGMAPPVEPAGEGDGSETS
jgi:phage tail-like protein